MIGIFRPGKARSNQSWIQSLRERRTDGSAGEGELYSEAGGDFVALLLPESLGGVRRAKSESGRTTALFAGRETAHPRSESMWAGRFEAEGLEAFREAMGPFVAVLFDQQSGHLSLVRPMAGQRALFAAPVPGGLIFSTDAFWMTSHPDRPFSLEPAAVGDYLATGVIWGEKTFSQGIRRLLPGSALVYQARTDALSSTSWGQYPTGSEATKESDAIEALDHALGKAMLRTLESPTPQALCLSAGLDSRTLLAVAQHQGMELDCVTSGVPGSSELKLTQRMCDQLNARHMQCFFGPEFAADLEKYAKKISTVTHGEADFMNMMMLFQGIEFRKQFGLKSVIRGHGGELMKLNDAYGFSVTPEMAKGDDHSAAKRTIFNQLSGSACLDEAKNVLQGASLEAIRTAAKPSFEAAYDRLAAHSEHVGQAISLMFLTQYNGRHTVNAVRCMMEEIDVSQPMLDEDVIEALLRMPIQLRTQTRLQRELLRRNQASLLKIPNSSLGVSLEASNRTLQAARLLHRVKTKLGWAREEIPEQWLLARMGDIFASVLLDDRTLDRDYLSADTLRQLVARSARGESSLNILLGRLTILESMMRQQP